jgi:polysaccharide export outer membrane protein
MRGVMKRSLALARFFLPVLVFNLSLPAWAGTLEDLGIGNSLSAQSPSAQMGMMPPPTQPTMMVTGPQSEIMQADRNLTSLPEQPAVPQEEPVDPDHYICGRGDQLQLNFWGRQNFNVLVPVDPEGRVFISRIGYVTVSGKTLTEARTMIIAKVKRYYPGLGFDLNLERPRSFLVHVVEGVNKPGLTTATPTERLSTVLLRAGGVTGSKRRIEIHHRNGTVDHADLVRYELFGERDKNPFLEDGDIIRVPSANLGVSVLGAVVRPGIYELTQTHDLAELLELAGGLRPEVTRSLPIRVHRNGVDELLRRTEVRFPASGEVPNIALKPNDEVVIPSKTELQRNVRLIGAIAGYKPGDEADAVNTMPFIEGDTVRFLVERVGYSPAADLASAYIVAPNGTQHPIDLERLLIRRDFSIDRPVHMGETVVVPRKRRAITVEGSVFHPGIFEYSPKLSLADYVAKAGGPNRSALEPDQYRLIKVDGRIVKHAGNASIEPGDTIVIPERSFSRPEVVNLVMGGAALVLSGLSVALLAISASKK